MRNYLGIASTLLLLAQPALAQYSTPTRDVENPDRSPYQEIETITLPGNIAGTFNVPIVTLPANTLLILDYASVLCTGPSAGAPIIVSLTTASNFKQFQYQLPLRSQGSTSTGTAVHVAATPVRIYADPDPNNSNTAVAATVVRRAASGTTTCVVTLSGHTISI